MTRRRRLSRAWDLIASLPLAARRPCVCNEPRDPDVVDLAGEAHPPFALPTAPSLIALAPERHIAGAAQKFLAAADTTGTTLYQANLRTYKLLRYGVPVQIAVGRPFEPVHLVDWAQPENNDFAMAEEVSLKGGYERRPDLVLYLNGIAIAVVELKRSSVEVADGVRQLITNQEAIFNLPFLPTVQLLLAGNDAQGLRYATVTTREEFFVEWKAALRPERAPVPPGTPGPMNAIGAPCFVGRYQGFLTF
jgi:Type I restriction enzyme R protein N terminus (HSDR_N)